MPNDDNNKVVEERAADYIIEELTEDFNSTVVDVGKSTILQQKDSTVTVCISENQRNEKSTNFTILDLGEFEKKIKGIYGIPEDKSLYILKLDIKQNRLKIPKIAYEIYYPLFCDNLLNTDYDEII